MKEKRKELSVKLYPLPPKKVMLISMNVTKFGSRHYADVIKLR